MNESAVLQFNSKIKRKTNLLLKLSSIFVIMNESSLLDFNFKGQQFGFLVQKHGKNCTFFVQEREA